MRKHRGNKRQRGYKSEDGKIVKRVPEFFRERLRMKKKLETQEGKQTYSLRKTIVEPVIGNIKYNMGFTEFLIRGLDGAKLELNIASISHNLKKIWALNGKINLGNKNIVFCLVFMDNYLNCDPACLWWRGCHFYKYDFCFINNVCSLILYFARYILLSNLIPSAYCN